MTKKLKLQTIRAALPGYLSITKKFMGRKKYSNGIPDEQLKEMDSQRAELIYHTSAKILREANYDGPLNEKLHSDLYECVLFLLDSVRNGEKPTPEQVLNLYTVK